MTGIFGGISAAMVTPYDSQGRVSLEMVGRLSSYIVDGGVGGIFVCGSTGEFPVLSISERKAVAEAVIDTVGSRGKVMVNISSMRFEETIDLIDHAQRIGADAVSTVAPYYFGFDQESIYNYFMEISHLARQIPIYLYNIPSNTKNIISPALLARLCADCNNIVGIKDSSMDFMVLTDYLQAVGPGVQVMTGNDAQILCTLQIGGAGGVLASAGLFPRIVSGIMADFEKNDIESAKKKQGTIYKLRDLMRRIGPVSAHKKTLEYLGFQIGPARLPFRELNKAEEKELQSGLKGLGLL